MVDSAILSWNTGGLNMPHKQVSSLEVLQRKKTDIALLQETHLLSGDIKYFADKHYYTLASSSACSKTKGVAIVARRLLKIKILGTWGDTAGRLAVVRAEVSGRKIAFLSIYAPNSYDRHFYAMLTDKMLKLSEYSFLAGADFNAVWNATVDRSGSSETNDQKSASAAMRAWSNSLGLIDLR